MTLSQHQSLFLGVLPFFAGLSQRAQRSWEENYSIRLGGPEPGKGEMETLGREITCSGGDAEKPCSTGLITPWDLAAAKQKHGPLSFSLCLSLLGKGLCPQQRCCSHWAAGGYSGAWDVLSGGKGDKGEVYKALRLLRFIAPPCPAPPASILSELTCFPRPAWALRSQVLLALVPCGKGFWRPPDSSISPQHFKHCSSPQRCAPRFCIFERT